MTSSSTPLRPSPHVATIAAISYRLVDAAWAFVEDRAAEIEEHWRKRLAQNPHLFNGSVLLMHSGDSLPADGGTLEGTCFLADYKSFLAWGDFGFPDRSVTNVFAMAALRAADGAFLLGEMGPATASAGRMYFPAGTPDPGDLRDGNVDLEASVRRELKEETGLAAEAPGDELHFAPDWIVVVHGAYIACMKVIRSTRPAAELVARVDAFLAQQRAPELARLRPVYSAADFDEEHMPAFMRAYMQHVWRAEGKF